MKAWKLQDRPPTPIEESVERGRRIVGRGGVLSRVVEVTRSAEAIDIIRYRSYFHAGGPARGARKSGLKIAGSSVGLRWESACGAAIGEGVERFSLSWRKDEEQVSGTLRELDGAALDPRRFALFSREQYARSSFPFRPFSDDERLIWVRGWSLTKDRELLVPAESVYLDCTAPGRIHDRPTGSGVAAAFTLEEALRSALYELIERDACLIAWLTGRKVPRVSPAAFRDRTIDDLVSRMDRAGVGVHLLDITTDLGVPAYLAIGEARRGMPSIALGAAARLSPRQAATQAILESAHTWNAAYSLILQLGSLSPVEDLSSMPMRHFQDHVYLYAHAWMKPRLRFLLDSDEEIAPRAEGPGRSLVEEVRETVRRVEARGYEVLACEVTAPEVAEAGYRVVRVMVPGLVQLRAGIGSEHLGSPRLPASGAGLNRDPHPFS